MYLYPTLSNDNNVLVPQHGCNPSVTGNKVSRHQPCDGTHSDSTAIKKESISARTATGLVLQMNVDSIVIVVVDVVSRAFVQLLLL